MAVIGTTYYSASATHNGVTWSAGPSTVASFTLPNVAGNTGAWRRGYVQFGTARGYPYWLALTNPLVAREGPFVVNWGEHLYSETQEYVGGGFWLKYVNRLVTVVWNSFVTYSGSRTISVSCGAGGSIAPPANIAAGTSGVVVTRPDGNMDAAASVITLVAVGSPSTGTLTSRGNAQGTFVQWTWPTASLSSAAQTAPGIATASTASFNLLAGSGDATITATFSQTQNSSLTWSPKNANIVVHLLNDSLVETESSINAVSSSTAWSAFRSKCFSAFTCTSGTPLQSWYTSYGTGVYLLNVESAVFSVTPVSGKRVYAWRLELPDGSFVEKGSTNTTTIAGFADGHFAEGCKVHLYMTSGTPNPRIIYDGFDPAGTVPADQRVLAAGAYFAAGAAWTSNGTTTPVSVTLSPLAWAARALNQVRSVIVDGVETQLANVAGTGASVTSGSESYTVNHVSFKQAALATDATLTVNIVVDTNISPAPTVSLNVSQEGTALATLTATGTAGYYKGSGPLTLNAVVNYGATAPSQFTLRMVPEVLYDGDDIETDSATLVASETTRAVTFYVTQVVLVGGLSAVAVNLTRDVSIGTTIATSAGPVTQSVAGGISVTMTPGQASSTPIYVECSVVAGYTAKSVRVLSADGTKTYYAGVAPLQAAPIYMNIPRADTGLDIKVVMVVAAEIVGIPSIQPMRPDDLGKFAAVVTSVGGYGDFRAGDSVTIAVSPISVSGSPLTGAAIGSPLFNDVEVSPVRTGTSVAATVTLALGTNVFKIPVYAVFTASATPAGAGSPTLTTAWDVNDTLTISATVYQRIGSIFTMTAPLASTGYTVISARVNRRAISAGFPYIEAGVLLPAVASETTRTFTSTLRGPTECIAVYAQGVQYPAVAVAAYNYNTDSYITQGVRPSVRATAVSPAALSDNTIASVTWPATTPGTAYKAAAFLVQTVTTTAVLPQVEIRPSSTTPARLEVWNPVSGVWLPYTAVSATLDVAFTFFRVTVGDAPENLVSVVIETAVDPEDTDVPGCAVYATSGVVYDGNFALPATMQARARYVLHVRVTPPYGYIVTGWFVDGVLTASGASLSVIVPDVGMTLKPQLAVREFAASTVMVLNADPDRTDEGIWVSKLYRAQFPWKPLTANVVARPVQSPVTLAVMKDGDGEAPTRIDTENPGTVVITTTGDGMRRLPPGQIQKTRFVRYMVVLTGEVSVSSVAIGSGAETMKGGH